MLTQNPLQTVKLTSAGTIAPSRFVGVDGNYAAAGARAYGVTEYDSTTGDSMPVHTYGVVIVEASGIIAAGADVAAGSNGKAAAANGTTDKVNGIAVDAAAADGDLIRVKLL